MSFKPKLAFLLLFALGAGPSPEEARKSLDAAKSAVLIKLIETPSYKSAIVERNSLLSELEAARANGTPEERLAASSRFVKADQAVRKLQEAAFAADRDTAEAEKVCEASIKKVAEVRAKRFLLNEKIVEFCRKNIGQQVGDGQCGTLARDACKYAGAKSWIKIGQFPGYGDYEWGKLICVVGDDGGKTAENAVAGDIIQIRNAQIGNIGASHHTAVVESSNEDGTELLVFEQNVSGKMIVRESTYHLDELSSGWIRVYRPIP